MRVSQNVGSQTHTPCLGNNFLLNKMHMCFLLLYVGHPMERLLQMNPFKQGRFTQGTQSSLCSRIVYRLKSASAVTYLKLI